VEEEELKGRFLGLGLKEHMMMMRKRRQEKRLEDFWV
jgi:hypothetical protein